jgi:hypothetical protein
VNSTRRASVIGCAATLGAIKSTSATAAKPQRILPNFLYVARDIRVEWRSPVHDPRPRQQHFSAAASLGFAYRDEF